MWCGSERHARVAMSWCRGSILREQCYGWRRGTIPTATIAPRKENRRAPLRVRSGGRGFCEPRSADQMPFVNVAVHGYTPEARKVARLMIAAGADVNRISPDGIVPLQ